MPKQKEDMALIMQNLVNEENLDHLSLKDLRNILLNIQPVVVKDDGEDDEVGEDELVKRYIL